MSLYVWIGVAVVLAIIEMFTVGILAIWFAIGAAISAIVVAIWPETSLAMQLLIFAVSSFVLFFLTRNKIRSSFEKTSTPPVFSILGKTAIVTKEIDSINGTGQISINGDIWSAKAKDNDAIIPENTKVKVLEISGVRAVVEPIDEEKKD